MKFHDPCVIRFCLESVVICSLVYFYNALANLFFFLV
jgi:hypothetical protein